MPNTRLITAPGIFPVTLEEIKEQLNFTSSIDDNLMRRNIATATREAEAFTRRKFCRQTWDIYFDAWQDCFYLPYGRLQSVTHLKYTDTDGTTTTLDSSTYDITTETDILLGRVSLAYNQSWPSATLALNNPIQIRFTCGWYRGHEREDDTVYTIGEYVEPTRANATGLVYECTSGGTSDSSEPTWPTTIWDTVNDNTVEWTAVGEAVPDDIRQAILIEAAGLYELREDQFITQGAVTVNLGRMQRNLYYYKIKDNFNEFIREG